MAGRHADQPTSWQRVRARARRAVIAFFRDHLRTDRPEVTQHRVAVPGLPAAVAGTRVAQLTDFHHGPLVRLETVRAAVDRCNALSPDLVVLTGDYVTARVGNIHACAAELARLRSRLGTFAVLGNHDHLTGGSLIAAALEAHGIDVMTNRSREVVGGLWLVGVDDRWRGKPEIERALAGVPDGTCPLLLTHNPAICRRAMVRPMLILCGHTHGGQIYLPALTQRLIPSVRATGYLRGWYREGMGQIYINRGIGTVGIPLRLFCRPEVALFTLEGAPPAEWRVQARRIVASCPGEGA